MLDVEMYKIKSVEMYKIKGWGGGGSQEAYLLILLLLMLAKKKQIMAVIHFWTQHHIPSQSRENKTLRGAPDELWHYNIGGVLSCLQCYWLL